MPRYQTDEFVPHFCTITVHEWLPVFIDRRYIDPLIESLTFCRKHKGLQLHAFVVMPNHIHLIVSTTGDLQHVMRDYKRFTSRSIHERLKEDGRATLLAWLEHAAEPARRRRGEFSFWQSSFHPQAIYTEAVFEQKLSYLHENPVRKALVSHPEDWWFSSASNYAECDQVCLEVDFPEF
jgi:REP element-mobilizing transposase RayT